VRRLLHTKSEQTISSAKAYQQLVLAGPVPSLSIIAIAHLGRSLF
jgi:hypothetical protein